MKYGHAGGLCSFDAFFRRRILTDPVLQQFAIIVRKAAGAITGPVGNVPGRPHHVAAWHADV